MVGSLILHSCPNSCLVDCVLHTSAWYEWYPDYSYDFSGIGFSAGDIVTVTVTATSKTGGTAKIKNHSTGRSVSHTFSGQPSLCEYNAEWIVEDFESDNSLVPLANFGTVTFVEAFATWQKWAAGAAERLATDGMAWQQCLTACGVPLMAFVPREAEEPKAPAKVTKSAARELPKAA